MTKLTKYGGVQIDSLRKCKKFVVNIKKINFIKFALK